MEKNGSNRDGMDRREFFQYAGIAGAALALGSIMPGRTQAAEAQRKEDFGKAHVIEFNKDTGTPGFWDNSRAPVLTIKSGEVVHIETGRHLLGKMKPGVTIEGWKEMYEQAIAKDPDVYTYP
ncbi:MAG: twin-arginine translocation signal domain-containing protein, partial [Deltaproteobacteria bacterium]|nr:twin-arginine translocation signal domain-containing protein [Deltaproteobacteria bacterium]